MLKKFQRPVESENFTRTLQNSLAEMQETLDCLSSGHGELSESRELIISLIENQDDRGFWSLIPSPYVDSDARVDFWYTPTYIATAIMMHFYLHYKSAALKIPSFEFALKKGLEASTGRGLNGHGYEAIAGRLDALQIFSKGNLMHFVRAYPECSPKFTDMITNIIKWLTIALETGNTKGDWGEEYKPKMEEVQNLLSKDNTIKVFVYGTLMEGKTNHRRYLSKARFLGKGTVKGYSLYHLGSFPGVVHSKRVDKVKGEVYEIDHSSLEDLDVLEGEGSLYIRELTNVYIGENTVTSAYIYVYNHQVSEKQRIDFKEQPWGVDKKVNDYVWYASFGSNMLYERFLSYIQGGLCRFNGRHYDGCRDKTSPLDSRPITIPYNMYYGNLNSSWGPGGVSFLDSNSNGKALGRMYLITREQFQDVCRQEGTSDNWYNKTLSLGKFEGIEIFTVTNDSIRPICAPGNAYLEVLKMGVKETYPEMNDFEIMKYLVKCGN